MVYTVTFNPAVDYVVHTSGLTPGYTNRADHEEIFFGGKGINVSLVLKELGVKSKAFGFTAGFTGAALEEFLLKAGIDTDFVRLESGFSRINVKIKGESETELNGAGPDIPEKALNELFKKLDVLRGGDTLVLAGSIPRSLPDNVYEKILRRFGDMKIRAVVDASGGLLKNVLKYRPFLIKPNNFELGEIFGTEIRTVNEIVIYARKLQEAGAANILVSRAGDGAVLLDEHGQTHICGVCPGEVKNSVGAGDSMVAGFLAGIESGDYEYALKLGTAAGGAAAFSEGLPEKKTIFELMEQL